MGKKAKHCMMIKIKREKYEKETQKIMLNIKNFHN